jgi:hypothetical protein
VGGWREREQRGRAGKRGKGFFCEFSFRGAFGFFFLGWGGIERYHVLTGFFGQAGKGGRGRGGIEFLFGGKGDLLYDEEGAGSGVLGFKKGGGGRILIFEKKEVLLVQVPTHCHVWVRLGLCRRVVARTEAPLVRDGMRKGGGGWKGGGEVGVCRVGARGR